MRRPIIPVALFLLLVASVLVSLPLQGSLVVLSVVGFMGSLAGLAWWVLWSDSRPIPGEPPRDEDVAPLEEDWEAFEEAFWDHVAEHEATSELE